MNVRARVVRCWLARNRADSGTEPADARWSAQSGNGDENGVGRRERRRLKMIDAGLQRVAATGVVMAAIAFSRRSASRCANRYATSEPATATNIGTRLS